MKNNLDERQNQEVRQIAANAFYIMFIISAVSIVIQLVLFGQGMKSVLGETVILLAGGGVYLICLMKKGIFSLKNRQMTLKEVIMISVFCSGIFSIFYGILIARLAKPGLAVGKYVGYFFTGITLLCIAVLLIMDRWAMHSRKKNEEKYGE